MKRFRLRTAALVLILLLAGMTGIASEEPVPTDLRRYLSAEQYSAILQLLESVTSNRNYQHILNSTVLTKGILKGIISVLQDEYATVMNISDHVGTIGPQSAAYVHCGFSIAADSYGRLFVTNVGPGSPASRLIYPGDLLLQVNSQNTAGFSPWELMPSLMGPAGTEVEVVVQTERETPRHVFLTRKESGAPVVGVSIGSLRMGRWVEKEEGNWAWLKVYSYTDPATLEQWTDAIRRIWDSPAVEGILLDLRDNGGGENSCITTLGDFFPRGEVLVHFEGLLGDKPWKETVYNVSLPCARLIAYPVVVLVNERTASLAEIVAATLQEQRDIKLVGNPTFGKGTTQTWLQLKGRFAAHLTLARWLTPDGASIHGIGLTPDIEIDNNSHTRNIDEQLVRAVQVLQNR